MDLAELFELYRGDRSFDQLADAAGVSSSALHRATRRPLPEIPAPKVIRAIARVLAVDEITVLLAAAESAQISTARVAGPFDDLPPQARSLTARQRASLRAVIAEFIAANQALNDARSGAVDDARGDVLPATPNLVVEVDAVDLSSVRAAKGPRREPKAQDRQQSASGHRKAE